MTSPKFDCSSREQVEAQLSYIDALAEIILDQRHQDKSPIVTFVGAGASASAGLPESRDLKNTIFERLVKDSGKSVYREVLNIEARDRFKGCNGLLELSLIEFASIVSLTKHGRDTTQKEVRETLQGTGCRPLVYELLAHLAKHKFLESFVSLNYDNLLDDALSDEIADQLRCITNPADVPGPEFKRPQDSGTVFLFKPFGSISNDKYLLTPEDTVRYGPEPVWDFIVKHAFESVKKKVYILLVGYRAKEKAFDTLMHELENLQGKEVQIFVVDPGELSDQLKRHKLVHIQLPADLAFDLLLQFMRVKYRSRPNNVWIPVARHKVVSYCLDKDSAQQQDVRLSVELLLQAVKSRGFFSIGAVAEIDRLKKYSHEASKVLEDLCRDKILEAHPWSGDERKKLKYLKQDYQLMVDNQEVADYILKITKRDSRDTINEWVVEDANKVKMTTMRSKDFLVSRLDEIAAAPEIEVVNNVSPVTDWVFDRRVEAPSPLNSVDDLAKRTSTLFKKAFREATGQIHLYGIWNTGEWIFHSTGWAYEVGKEVEKRLSEGSLMMHLVLANIPATYGTRAERANEVGARLSVHKAKGRCELFYLDWWRLNRSLTLLCWPKSTDMQQGGIYMQRRFATPIVAPVEVVQENHCKVLRDLFTHYKLKARD